MLHLFLSHCNFYFYRNKSNIIFYVILMYTFQLFFEELVHIFTRVKNEAARERLRNTDFVSTAESWTRGSRRSLPLARGIMNINCSVAVSSARNVNVTFAIRPHEMARRRLSQLRRE